MNIDDLTNFIIVFGNFFIDCKNVIKLDLVQFTKKWGYSIKIKAFQHKKVFTDKRNIRRNKTNTLFALLKILNYYLLISNAYMRTIDRTNDHRRSKKLTFNEYANFAISVDIFPSL